MLYVLALIDTTVGKIALERFASKAGMSQAQMRREIEQNPALAAYFAQVCKTAMEAVPPEG